MRLYIWLYLVRIFYVELVVDDLKEVTWSPDRKTFIECHPLNSPPKKLLILHQFSALYFHAQYVYVMLRVHLWIGQPLSYLLGFTAVRRWMFDVFLFLKHDAADEPSFFSVRSRRLPVLFSSWFLYCKTFCDIQVQNAWLSLSVFMFIYCHRKDTYSQNYWLVYRCLAICSLCCLTCTHAAWP